jgi:hypothetical protein
MWFKGDTHASKQGLTGIDAGQLHTRYVHNTYYFCPQLRKMQTNVQFLGHLFIFLKGCHASGLFGRVRIVLCRARQKGGLGVTGYKKRIGTCISNGQNKTWSSSRPAARPRHMYAYAHPLWLREGSWHAQVAHRHAHVDLLMRHHSAGQPGRRVSCWLIKTQKTPSKKATRAYTLIL